MLSFAARVGRLVTVGAFLAAVVTVASLAAIQLGGQQLFTVISGSMTPTFVAGDTVLVRHVEPKDLEPDMVVTFHAPGSPDHLTTHRILSLRPMPNGLFVQTKGDANQDPDPDFTHSANVVGQVTTVVPVVGRWLMFYQSPTGRLIVLGTPLLLLALGQLAQTWRDVSRSRRRRAIVSEGVARRRRRPTGPSPAVTMALAVGLTVVAGAGGVVLGKSTGAVFAATTTSASTFSTRTWCTATTYGQTVLADAPDLFYRLDESSGTTAVDAGQFAVNGTYSGTKTFGAAGGICNGANASVTFTNAQITNAARFSSSTNFGIEAWFKTTSGGGVIAAMGSTTVENRVLYMTNSGQLVFGARTATAASSTVTSPAAYADGAWHHVAGVGTATGLVLYVDGVSVASVTQAQTAVASASWYVGSDNLASAWPSEPTRKYWLGQLDEVAIYDGPLVASRVLAHYRAGGGS